MWKFFEESDLERLKQGMYYNLIVSGRNGEPTVTVAKVRGTDLVEPNIDLVLLPESIIKINTTPLDKNNWEDPLDCDWRTLEDGVCYNVYGLLAIFADESYMCVQKVQDGLIHTASGMYITKIVKISPNPAATHKQIYGV